jgi:hypothetical protein
MKSLHIAGPWRSSLRLCARLVLYLCQDDVERAVRNVCAERGEAWVKYQVDWKLKGPYAVRRNLVGLDGLIALYQDYRSLTDVLFDRLSLDKMAIENSGRDWARYNQQILDRLGLGGHIGCAQAQRLCRP